MGNRICGNILLTFSLFEDGTDILGLGKSSILQEGLKGAGNSLPVALTYGIPKLNQSFHLYDARSPGPKRVELRFMPEETVPIREGENRCGLGV